VKAVRVVEVLDGLEFPVLEARVKADFLDRNFTAGLNVRRKEDGTKRADADRGFGFEPIVGLKTEHRA
jgi:hypothetical protein